MATEVLEHCHHVLFDDISAIFDLKNADKNHLVAMVKTLIDGYRHTDVREYYYYIHHSLLNYMHHSSLNYMYHCSFNYIHHSSLNYIHHSSFLT